MNRFAHWISLIVVLCGCGVIGAADIYVSPTGNDGQDGSLARPLQSLEAARDRIRAARDAGKLTKEAVTVWLRCGDYVRENSLELTKTDSGTAEYPVVWRAYPNETVRLLGGRRLTEIQTVSDPAVAERLAESARTAVREVDLRALGITEYGEWASRGFARPTVAAHCELFIDGVPMTVARWPNEGEWDHIAGFPQEHAQDDGHGGKIGKLEDGFQYAGDRPRRWKDTSDLWVHGYWSWDWANSYEHVASIDLEQRLIKTAPPFGQYGFRVGQRVQYLNMLEELDQPGEWVLDRKTGKLYFWPPNALTSDSQVLLSLLGKPFVKMQDVSYVTLQSLRWKPLGRRRSRLPEVRRCRFWGVTCATWGTGESASREGTSIRCARAMCWIPEMEVWLSRVVTGKRSRRASMWLRTATLLARDAGPSAMCRPSWSAAWGFAWRTT
jgi:hypothetical protein